MARYEIFFSNKNSPEVRKVILYFASDSKVMEFIDSQIRLGPELGQGQFVLHEDDGFYFVRKVDGILYCDRG